MIPTREGSSKFDPFKLIGQVFSYAKHIRLMVLMGAFGLIAGSVYYLFSKPTYRATSLLYAKGYGTAMSSGDVPGTGRAMNRGMMVQFRSRSVQLGAAKRLGIVGENATYEDLVFHIPTVRINPYDSNHIEVTVFAYDPEVVRVFASAMAEEYQEFQREGWAEFRDAALDRYAEQLSELDQKINESAESLTELERDEHLTEITIEQRSLLNIPRDLVLAREKLVKMDQILASVREIESGNEILAEDDRILKLLSRLTSFEEESTVEVGDVLPAGNRRAGSVVGVGEPSEVIVAPSDIAGIESWRKLELDKRMLEEEIDDKSRTFLPDHPEMQRLTRKLAETKRGLKTELEILRTKFDREYAKTEEQIGILESRMPEYHDVTEKLGKSALAYSNVVGSQAMWDKARDQLATKLASVSFNDEFDWVEMRFKGHLSLRDKIPVSPSKSKLAMFSLLLGLAAAFGVPTLLNLLDTSANTIPQLEEFTGLNGIGIVPLTSKEFLEEVHRSPAVGATIPNYLLECFRVIRSNIILHPNHHNHSQVIVITSSRPQEGKTTQAANLAWAFHSMGERTLLIDCDLRRGRIHELLGIDKSPGVTRMLLGEVPPDEAIVNTGLDGFDVIPRGPVIAGTTEILCQAAFERLLEQFREKYDRIVLDSPPVLGLSESPALQRVVDGTVLVVRAEKTSRKDVKDALTLLRKSEAHFFGFVLNAVDLSKASNYYYYYYYSAPYYDQFGTEDEPESPVPSPPSPHRRRQSAHERPVDVRDLIGGG